MKRFTLLLMIVAAVAAIDVRAQTVDEVISAAVEATGGLGNWKNLKTMKINGKIIQGNFEFAFISYQKRPNISLSETEVQGMKIIQGYDGTTAWMVNPMTGSSEPVKLKPEESAQMTNKMLESDFVDYKSKGHKAELEGSEQVNGIFCYKIKFSKKDGTIEYYLVDKETKVPLMMRLSMPAGSPGAGQTVELYFEDYDAVGDFFMPFTISTKLQSQTMMKMKMSSYEVNIDIADSIFAMPKK